MNHGLIFGVFYDRAIGSHRIASHLRNQGWDIECLDFVTYWTLPQLQEFARSRITVNTKFIGFSFVFDKRWSDTLEEFSKWVKETYPGIVLISGSQGYAAFESLYIDYYIVGYGEYAIDALLAYKFSNGSRPRFEVNFNGKKVINALTNYIAYPLLDPIIKYEDRDFINSGEWLGIEFSRGCKFSCDFCSFPVLGVKGDSTRTSESVRHQLLDAYDRFGVTNYFVTDETFNDSTEKISKFADVVQTLPFSPYFAGYIRADLLVSRPHDREELARMNFYGHFYGVETFNRDSGKSIKKGMDPDKLKQGLTECRDYFQRASGDLYRGSISLIFGLPYETTESLDSTLQWLTDNWADQSVRANILSIVAGELDRPSKLSLDYQKYGYQVAGPEITYPNPYFDHSKLSDRFVNWKTPWMHLDQALEYKFIFEKRFRAAIDTFTLPGLIADEHGNLCSVKERLALSIDDYQNLMHVNKNHLLLISKYIEQKLNYKPQNLTMNTKMLD